MKALRIVILAAFLALAVSSPASARDPGRWTLTGWSSVSNFYWQGVTSAGPTAPLYFSGISEGLYRTSRRLRQTAASSAVIPASVKAVEGYNHVGDISFDGADGKRVLLPLECYTPGATERPEHLRHGRHRHRGSQYSRVPLLREARSQRDREGDVGGGVAGWAAVDLERQRPACLPRGGREPGERRPGGRADPFGAPARRRRAAERRQRCGVQGRPPLPRGRAGYDLPDLVGEPGHRRAPSRGRAEQRAGRGGGAPHHFAAQRHAALLGRPAGAEAEFPAERRAAPLHPGGSPGAARDRPRVAPGWASPPAAGARDAPRRSGRGREGERCRRARADERERTGHAPARAGRPGQLRGDGPQGPARGAVTVPAARPGAGAREFGGRLGSAALGDLVDVADVRHVARLAARLSLKPAVQDLLEQRLARRAQRQREHVRVIPLPRAASGLGVGTEGGPDARHLVGRDRGAGAGPAADDALVGAPLRHVAGGGLAGPRPVVALLAAQRAVHDRIVAAATQLVEHGLGHAGALVGCDRDPHFAQPSLDACPSCPRSRSPRAV